MTCTLEQMMSNGADTVLLFTKDNAKESLEAHSNIIKLSSPVLAHALELLSTNSSSSSSSSELLELPLPGTSRADVLTVAQFLYPIVPLPKVSWYNLEVLLLEGRKWDMQVNVNACQIGQLNCVGMTYLSLRISLPAQLCYAMTVGKTAGMLWLVATHHALLC
jgi:hypothetical protein